MNKFLRESEKGFDRIDTEAGVIYGVKVLGPKSRNGRVYEDTAIRRAVPMYEGVTVNLNHQRIESGSRAVPDRQIQDRWGVLRNARYAEGSVYADLHYLKNHPMTPQLIEAADRFPDTFGLSHDAAGDEQVIDGERRVIELFEIRSVDVVAEPATNNGLFECCRPSRSTSRSERKQSRLALLEVKDGDGDGMINDGTPSQAPAPKKTPIQSKLTQSDKIARAKRRADRYDKMSGSMYSEIGKLRAQSEKAKGKEAEALRAKVKDMEKAAGKLLGKRFSVEKAIRKVTPAKSPFEFAPNVPKEPYTPMSKKPKSSKPAASKINPADEARTDKVKVSTVKINGKAIRTQDNPLNTWVRSLDDGKLYRNSRKT